MACAAVSCCRQAAIIKDTVFTQGLCVTVGLTFALRLRGGRLAGGSSLRKHIWCSLHLHQRQPSTPLEGRGPPGLVTSGSTQQGQLQQQGKVAVKGNRFTADPLSEESAGWTDKPVGARKVAGSEPSHHVYMM